MSHQPLWIDLQWPGIVSSPTQCLESDSRYRVLEGQGQRSAPFQWVLPDL